MRDAGAVLQGHRVLIVEDEMLIAMEIETLIAEQGSTVVGPAATVDRALALIQQERPDAAILDVNLNGSTAAPVAAALRVQDVPFVLATGYTGGQALEPELADAPRVDKPIDHKQLLRTLTQMIAG